jgi:hypothetical protein
MLDLKLASQVIDRPDVSWIIESWLPWQGTVESTILTERDWLVRSVTNLKQFRTSLAC